MELDTTYQAQKKDFGVRYNGSSTKKGILELDTTYQALKRDFSYFRVARKDQKEIFHASAWRGKTKWRFFMLLRDAERPKRDFSYFRATRKDQMENFYASAWRRKAKWRFFMLSRGAERPNGGFSCFRVARKGLNKLVICCRVYSMP